MPQTIQVLSDDEQQTILDALRMFATLPDDVDTTEYQYHETLADGEVEVNIFPRGEDGTEPGPVEDIRFAVRVADDAEWHESLSAYRPANLRNGGPLYDALAGEVEDVAESALGCSAEFTANKGGGWFTDDIPV